MEETQCNLPTKDGDGFIRNNISGNAVTVMVDIIGIFILGILAVILALTLRRMIDRNETLLAELVRQR